MSGRESQTDLVCNKEPIRDAQQVQTGIWVQNFRNIPKNSCFYFRVKLSSTTDEYFVFSPSLKYINFVGRESLHSIRYLTNNGFIVVIENTASKYIHVNKNTKLRSVTNDSEEDI